MRHVHALPISFPLSHCLRVHYRPGRQTRRVVSNFWAAIGRKRFRFDTPSRRRWRRRRRRRPPHSLAAVDALMKVRLLKLKGLGSFLPRRGSPLVKHSPWDVKSRGERRAGRRRRRRRGGGGWSKKEGWRVEEGERFLRVSAEMKPSSS